MIFHCSILFSFLFSYLGYILLFSCNQRDILHDYEDKIRERFSMLNQEDQKNLYINNNSPGIQEFLKYKKEMQEIMFRQLAELCPPVSKRGTVTKSR